MNTNDEIVAAEHMVADMLNRNWLLLAVRGLVAVLFGLLAFIWPGLTLLTLIFLFGIYAITNGALTLAVAFKAPKGYPRFAWLIVEGILSVLAGFIAFLMPGITALSLVILIAVWAIVTGAFEIVAAIRLRKVVSHEWLLVIAGIASLAFGVTILILPGAGALALVWWIGAYALAFGILLIMLAFRMRHWKKAFNTEGGMHPA
jgi:uncharacterized membrane protein HdeD (DUF308 family)